MAAGVLTCLYTADAGSLTAAELVQRLQVSPASISKAITLLENLGLVRRERDDGRRERYVADNDAWYQSMIAARDQHREARHSRPSGRLLRMTPSGSTRRLTAASRSTTSAG